MASSLSCASRRRVAAPSGARASELPAALPLMLPSRAGSSSFLRVTAPWRNMAPPRMSALPVSGEAVALGALSLESNWLAVSALRCDVGIIASCIRRLTSITRLCTSSRWLASWRAFTTRSSASWSTLALMLLRSRLPSASLSSMPRSRPFSLSDSEKGLDRGIEERLAEGSRDLSSINARVDQDALDRVVNALQEANQRLEVQSRVIEVKRRMQEAMIPTSQRSALTASQFDSSDNAPNATAAPDTGNADIRGGAMFRQGAVTRRNDDEPARDGNMSGSAAGNSEALALEGAATLRLDAQLKLEAIHRRDDAGDDEKADQGWFYSASQEQKSLLGFEDVRARQGFDRENAMSVERVPIRQKHAVRDYFLNLHESEKK